MPQIPYKNFSTLLNFIGLDFMQNYIKMEQQIDCYKIIQMKQIGILLLLLGILTVVQATIMITQPAKNPFSNNTLQYWYSNFGEIHFNKPAIYDLDVLNQTFCQEQKKGKQHYTTPTYVVVNGDRGLCSFPMRALRAQELGAQGIIYGSSNINYALSGRVVLSDDGHGRKVHITSLFISPTDFEELLNLSNVKIKTNFPLVQYQKSDVTLFLCSSSRKSYIFLRDFEPYYQQLSNFINLQIAYFTFPCQSCDEADCLLGENSCSYDFESMQLKVGKYILKQQFRQYNLFKYCKKNECMDKWFDYMNKFDEFCDINWVESESCSKGIMQNELKISENMNIGDYSNNMMEWRRLQTKTGVFWYPDLSVNGFRNLESLTAKSAFDMICQSLKSPPGQCLELQNDASQPNRTVLIVVLVISGCLLLVLGFLCYRRIVKRQITHDMSSKVNQLVAKYASKVSEQKRKKKEKFIQNLTQQI